MLEPNRINLRGKKKHEFPTLIKKVRRSFGNYLKPKRELPTGEKSIDLIRLSGYYYFFAIGYVVAVSEARLKRALNPKGKVWKNLALQPVEHYRHRRKTVIKTHEIDYYKGMDEFKICLDGSGNLLIGCNFYLSRYQIYRMRKALGIL